MNIATKLSPRSALRSSEPKTKAVEAPAKPPEEANSWCPASLDRSFAFRLQPDLYNRGLGHGYHPGSSEITNSRWSCSRISEISISHWARSPFPYLIPLRAQLTSPGDFGALGSSKTPTKASHCGSLSLTALVITIVERPSLLVDVLPNVVPLVRVLTDPPLNR